VRHDRGQLVLLAAVALAIALVPLTLAHLQLGYDEDVRAATVDDDRIREAKGFFRRTLVDTTATVPDNHSWTDRRRAVTAVRQRLRPTIEAINASGLGSRTVTLVSYNASRARQFAREHCPSGPARRFGPCRGDRGLVVQERAGRTHVLAAAVDVRVTAPQAERNAVTVVRAFGQPQSSAERLPSAPHSVVPPASRTVT
jgi:hypothetical protein